MIVNSQFGDWKNNRAGDKASKKAGFEAKNALLIKLGIILFIPKFY